MNKSINNILFAAYWYEILIDKCIEFIPCSLKLGNFISHKVYFLFYLQSFFQIGFKVYQRWKRFQKFISKDKVFSKHNVKIFDLNFRFVHLQSDSKGYIFQAKRNMYVIFL